MQPGNQKITNTIPQGQVEVKTPLQRLDEAAKELAKKATEYSIRTPVSATEWLKDLAASEQQIKRLRAGFKTFPEMKSLIDAVETAFKECKSTALKL